MISRTHDATYLNSVANDPQVRPYIGPGADPVDLTGLIADQANIALEAPHGGWLLVSLMPGVYELHTLFLPAGRGAEYFGAAREALRWMFTRTDCLEILTRCPDDNPGARMAAVKVGFRERDRREGIWQSGDGEACGISYQAFTIDDWRKRDDAISGEGWKVLNVIREAQNGPEGLAEEALARLTGAAVLMMRNGQAAKAVGMFNRAAVFLGYPSIVALREDLADIGGAIVHVKPEGVGVLLT